MMLPVPPPVPPAAPLRTLPSSLLSRLSWIQQALAIIVVIAFAGSALALSWFEIRRDERVALELTGRRAVAELHDEITEKGSLAKAAEATVAEEFEPGLRIEIRASTGRLLAARGAPAKRPPIGDGIVRLAADEGATVEVSWANPWREQAIGTLARALFAVALPLLVLSFLVARWLVRRELSPLSQMTLRAEALANAAGPEPLGVRTGADELVRLGEAFDRLLGRLSLLLRAERRFAEDVSHELRTPLLVLSGEVEWLQGQAGVTEPLRNGLRRIARQAEVMNGLVEALLLLRGADASSERFARTSFETVDLSDIVAQAVREVSSARPERVSNLTVVTEDDVLVSGHPVLLVAGLRNLLDNAFKFSEPGTAVRVRLFADADAAHLVVEDDGPGIDAEERERVFDAFYRGASARAESPGIGLGLPILRRVARAHGGDVAVGACASGGALFDWALPRLD